MTINCRKSLRKIGVSNLGLCPTPPCVPTLHLGLKTDNHASRGADQIGTDVRFAALAIQRTIRSSSSRARSRSACVLPNSVCAKGSFMIFFFFVLIYLLCCHATFKSWFAHMCQPFCNCRIARNHTIIAYFGAFAFNRNPPCDVPSQRGAPIVPCLSQFIFPNLPLSLTACCFQFMNAKISECQS